MIQEQPTDGPSHLAFWLSHLAEPCFVYVLRSGTAIKVGYAKDVMARIASLQTGNPVKLDLLYVLPGDQRLEWLLHKRLVGVRVRGEWFDGHGVRKFLNYVESLSDRMVTACDGSGAAPHYTDIDPKLCGSPRERDKTVTVRYVEPDPLSEEEQLARLRAHVADPRPHPLIHKRFSNNYREDML